MKRRKTKLKEKEVRVIKITGAAINEFVWEQLNKTGDEFLNLPEDFFEEDNWTYHLTWNKEKDELVFYALEFGHSFPVDLDSVDKYIEEHIGITADSMYHSYGNYKKPYKSFIWDVCQGDGSLDTP